MIKNISTLDKSNFIFVLNNENSDILTNNAKTVPVTLNNEVIGSKANEKLNSFSIDIFLIIV